MAKKCKSCGKTTTVNIENHFNNSYDKIPTQMYYCQKCWDEEDDYFRCDFCDRLIHNIQENLVTSINDATICRLCNDKINKLKCEECSHRGVLICPFMKNGEMCLFA